MSAVQKLGNPGVSHNYCLISIKRSTCIVAEGVGSRGQTACHPGQPNKPEPQSSYM